MSDGTATPPEPAQDYKRLYEESQKQIGKLGAEKGDLLKQIEQFKAPAKPDEAPRARPESDDPPAWAKEIFGVIKDLRSERENKRREEVRNLAAKAAGGAERLERLLSSSQDLYPDETKRKAVLDMLEQPETADIAVTALESAYRARHGEAPPPLVEGVSGTTSTAAPPFRSSREAAEAYLEIEKSGVKPENDPEYLARFKAYQERTQ